jgi:hypothetical protein
VTAPLAPLVDTADFKLWPGVIVDDTETASSDFVLLAASNFVRMESGNPSRWADEATDPCPPAVKTVVVQVAARVWRNPEGATMRTEGPFSEQFVQTVEAGLYLTDSERRVVERANGARPGLWSLNVTRDDDALPAGYYDVFSGETVPASPYPADQWIYGSPA